MDLDTIARELSAIERKLSATFYFTQESRISNDEKLDRIERKLDTVAAAVCAKEIDRSCEEDVEDRKRLKERLKEALEQSTQSREKSLEADKEDWMEYIFGICKPDGRVGKEGSRSTRSSCRPFVQNRIPLHL